MRNPLWNTNPMSWWNNMKKTNFSLPFIKHLCKNKAPQIWTSYLQMQQGREKAQLVICTLWQAVVCKTDTFLSTARKCLWSIHTPSITNSGETEHQLFTRDNSPWKQITNTWPSRQVGANYKNFNKIFLLRQNHHKNHYSILRQNKHFHSLCKEQSFLYLQKCILEVTSSHFLSKEKSL